MEKQVKWAFKIVLLMLMSVLCSAKVYGNEPLVWGYIDFPPRMAAGHDDHPNGELAGVVQGILASLNITYEPLVLPTRRMLLEVQKNSIDLALLTPSQVANPENYLFSHSIFGCVELHAFWIPENTPPIETLNDLNFQRLIFINGFRYPGLREKIEPKGIVGVEGHDRALQALKLKRGDYLLGFERAINTLLSRQGEPDLARLKIMQFPIFVVLNREYHEAPTLIEQVDAAHHQLYPEHFRHYQTCGKRQL